MRRLALMTLLLGTPSIAHADAVAEAAGDDAELYKCKGKTREVAMTFKPEMELRELVTWAIGLTCKPFMLDPRIVAKDRKVTLIAPATMSSGEAYNMFLAALATVGLTVVPKGKGFRIVDAPTARTQALPIYSKQLPDDNDQIVRYVVRPNYTKPETLQKAFGALRSDAGDIQLVGSLVLITDYGSHVRSMMTIARLIDVPEGTDAIYTIPVHHADAKLLATELESILGLTTTTSAPGPGKADAASTSVAVPSKLLVDARTNTLIVAATEVAYHRVQALVERLDVALDIEGGASIHVYHLAHGIAADLAAVLTSALSPTGKGAATAAPGSPVPSVDPTGPRVQGEARVIAEAASNSLVVLSSGRDFLAIKEIIQQLDAPRRQVYIEGMIVEISLSNDLELGVSAHGFLPGSGNSVLLGGVQTSSGVSSLDVETLGKAAGLVTGVLSSGTTTLMGVTIPSYGALVTALATKTNSNVMSLPSLTAVDNQLTHLTIGTNIPYKKGLTYGGLSGTSQQGSTTVNIDRETLDLKLDIKPHISPDGTVLLEIDHTAKDLGETNGELGPTWNTRELKGQVVVRDQQTVVIGGLISTKEYVSKTSVPILGDIPVIGSLFRHTIKQKRKANLLILLTPYIIRDQLDIEEIRARRMRQTDELVRSFAALDGMKYLPKIDYARKRGLVEEINRAVESVEEDAEVLKSLERTPPVKSGAVD